VPARTREIEAVHRPMGAEGFHQSARFHGPIPVPRRSLLFPMPYGFPPPGIDSHRIVAGNYELNMNNFLLKTKQPIIGDDRLSQRASEEIFRRSGPGSAS